MRPANRPRLAAALVLLLALTPAAGFAGTASEVVFSDYSPLAGNAELAGRLLSPLAAAQLQQQLAQQGKTLTGQPIDLSQEKFLVFVPSVQPAGGYGLLVFVPPWRRAKLPDGWADVLDALGMIFVSADESGNDTNPFGRRDPLAVLAEQNVVKHYAVNSDRVFVGGFSGGSRIALRLAMAYPDLFDGALLDAGSDTIGEPAAPLPTATLFARFQEHSRLVYLSGDSDVYIRQTDLASMQSLEDWCVFGAERFSISGTGHDAAPASALERALDLLLRAEAPDAEKLSACRSEVTARLESALANVQALINAGRRDDARNALHEIDSRYGGLAAPRSVALAKALGGN